VWLHKFVYAESFFNALGRMELYLTGSYYFLIGALHRHRAVAAIRFAAGGRSLAFGDVVFGIADHKPSP
jgi:hypothetical protein